MWDAYGIHLDSIKKLQFCEKISFNLILNIRGLRQIGRAR